MSPGFDVRTAYFLLGMLSLAGALGVHASLRLRGRKRHQTWAAAGACFGAGLMMIAFRGWVPELMTYELSHLLLIAALLLHISALEAEVGRGWPVPRLVLVLATSGLIYGVLTALDRSWGLMFNVAMMGLGSALVVARAWRVWRHTQRLPALVIAAGFALMLTGLAAHGLALLPTSAGRDGPFAPAATQVTLMMGGLFASILGHLGYLGLQFLRAAAEQVASERAAAEEAERSRQLRAREAALHDLLEERNRLIQRIARSEAASDLALFATALPHELSQPLCAVTLSLDNLKTGLTRLGADTLLPVVQSIKTSNERVLNLLQQLRILLQTQDHAGHEILDLRAVVLRTLPILEGSFGERRIRLLSELPVHACEVRASATQLQQLLLILCAHALDDLQRCPPPAGQEARVRVTLEAGVQQVRLWVEDSSASAATRLRGQLAAGLADQAAQTPHAGPTDRLGVGLTVAQRVAQSHSGSLDIDDSSLGGTAFVLTLPTAEAVLAVERQWPPEGTQVEAEGAAPAVRA